MKMEKSQNSATKDKISKYEPAPIAKRLFAGIMDGAVFLFTFFAFALWVFTPLSNPLFGYDKTQELGKRYWLASHLYLPEKLNDDGEVVVVEVKDSTGNLDDYSTAMLYYHTSVVPSEYLNRVYYYYHNFKCNVDIELPLEGGFDALEDHFASPNYDKEINGVLPVNYYTNAWFSENVLRTNTETSYFVDDVNSENYVASIQVKEGVNNEDVIKYLKNEAYTATSDLNHSDFLEEIQKQTKNVQYFIFMTPFALSFGIYFILIPMLMKDGETLGKKTMQISVISMDGYAAKKRQILFREVLLFLVIGLLGIVVGIGLTSLAIIGVGVVLLFIGTLIPKNKRSIFDFAAYTIVVDSVHSVWFRNPEDEARHQKELEDNMSKYKKYIPDNPNLIQVGSTIVDESYKQEPSKQKSKKIIK